MGFERSQDTICLQFSSVLNFYCDPHLFLELKEKKVLACGTVRPNRKGFPADIVLTRPMERQTNRGDYLWRNNDTLAAMEWHDN